ERAVTQVGDRQILEVAAERGRVGLDGVRGDAEVAGAVVGASPQVDGAFEGDAEEDKPSVREGSPAGDEARLSRNQSARRGASPPFRNLPPGRSASRRTATGWAPCVRGEQSRSASRRTATGWAPCVRGEQSRSASRRTATGWAPCVRGEQSEVAPAKPALESGT